MVRARIARVLLGNDASCARLGAITLKVHQQSAVARAEQSLEEFGGVLLCDDVGMGKTFVATAIARGFARTLIVAPAALESMWQGALAVTDTCADFLSFERLSRTNSGAASHTRYDLVVVDEAHHVRNKVTRRFRNLAMLARDARVLLLTATPIHNRTADVLALLSVFLGSRARTLTAGELARCVVRREHNDVVDGIAIPAIIPTVHRHVSDDARIVRDLMSLPPPLPVRDGGLGGELIGRGLVHQWASSEAALHEAVRRRIARAAALTCSLESGNYPTARELETWTYGEGALQLGFAELLSSPTDDASALLDCVRAHSAALRGFHALYGADAALDLERGEHLRAIRAAHPASRIVAFAQYAETVSALYRLLSPAAGVAMLTAQGGLVAGGRLTRDETLARFAPSALRAHAPGPAERIDLLLTTDLLSEGVNLQDADVVVHVDVPWTAARMEQRVGRIARMGSVHQRVHTYLIHPPASAARLLKNELLVHRKWSFAKRVIGTSARDPFARESETEGHEFRSDSVPGKVERLRGMLESWRRSERAFDSLDAGVKSGETLVASVQAPASGFVAAVSVGDRSLFLASTSGGASVDLDSQIAACALCEGTEMETGVADYERAVNQIRAWVEHDLASVAAGVERSQSSGRKRLLNRIDAAIESAPPHVRASQSRVAARARTVALRLHGAAIEAELERLARSPLPDHEFLEVVAGLESARLGKKRDARRAKPRIHALLLLRERR